MKQDRINLLIIEDEAFDVDRIVKTLTPFKQRIHIEQVVSSGKAALECLKKEHDLYDVVIMDYQISGGLYGEQLIAEIKKIDTTLQIIIITKMTINQTDVKFANQLISSGAFWFGTKYPGDIEDYIYQPTDFVLSILNANEKKRLEVDRIRSRKKLDRSIEAIVNRTPLIGISPMIQELKRQIEKYAVPNANVLILGESGTGKELVASNLHYVSKRKYENFITVNCAAIPKDLVESELFGFEKGSFTGARDNRIGLFEQADGGTIFLDEVTELPLPAQAKLLRVLQEGEIDKIGRKQKHRVNVRVLAATNKDIRELLSKKLFREDLYYRLNILQIKVPPLRERAGDISMLADYFIRFYSSDLGQPAPKVSKGALKLLNNFGWPGNVRQLKNVVQRLVILGDDEITESIAAECIGIDRPENETRFAQGYFASSQIETLKEMEQRFKKEYIRYVRKSCRTDTEAAEKLGIAPSNYHRLCKELGLK